MPPRGATDPGRPPGRCRLRPQAMGSSASEKATSVDCRRVDARMLVTVRGPNNRSPRVCRRSAVERTGRRLGPAGSTSLVRSRQRATEWVRRTAHGFERWPRRRPKPKKGKKEAAVDKEAAAPAAAAGRPEPRRGDAPGEEHLQGHHLRRHRVGHPARRRAGLAWTRWTSSSTSTGRPARSSPRRASR